MITLRDREPVRSSHSAGREPREAAISPHPVVAERADPGAEGVTDTERPLIGIGGFGVVVEQIDLGIRRAGCDQLIQPGSSHIGGIPGDGRSAIPRLIRGKHDPIDRVLQPVALVESGVEEESVVIPPGASEHDGLPGSGQIVSEAEPRLNLPAVGTAGVAI